MGPLTGVKVLDFTHYLSGPYCTMLLSDLGAEVIKLECPPTGDPSRYSPPSKEKKSVYFTSSNRGKKSVIMNFKDEKQREIFYKMVETADVVIDNFKSDTMEKYYCGYEDLCKINPRIVCTSISGFGNTGPLKGKPAYDLAVQAMSGIMSMSGELGGSPLKLGISIADLLGGIYGCLGTLAALYETWNTGVGRKVDVAMLDACIAAMEQGIAQYGILNEDPIPMGNQQVTTVPFGDYITSDGQPVLICPASDDQFQKLCEVVGHPEICETELTFAAERMTQRDRVNEMFRNYIGAMTTEEFCSGLDEKKLAYGLINDIEQVVNHPQIKERNMIAYVNYPDGSRMMVPASPFNISGMEKCTEFTANPLGSDTFSALSQYVSDNLLHEIYDSVLENIQEAVREKETAVD